MKGPLKITLVIVNSQKGHYHSHHHYHFQFPHHLIVKKQNEGSISNHLLTVVDHSASSSLLPVADSRNPFPGKNTSCLPHSQNGSNFEQGGLLGLGGKEDPEAVKGGISELMGRIGSRPPSCTHRCGGCSPCDAIQIPAITYRTTVEYANYEPEGWKCKCGPHFFDP